MHVPNIIFTVYLQKKIDIAFESDNRVISNPRTQIQSQE